MRPSKIYKFIKQIDAQYLAITFVVSLMLPVLILVYTEKNPFWTSVACVMIPLGGYTLWGSLFRCSGWMVWLGIPLIIFSAFQIVLSCLFGNSVVSADMLLNLFTTNSDEAGELLANIYPSIVVVILIYVPQLWIALGHIRRRVLIDDEKRQMMAFVGTGTFLLGCLVLLLGCGRQMKHVVRDEIFPINVTYNIWVALSESRRIANYHELSKNFRYHSRRVHEPICKEIYVLIIGESSRVASWQIFGYERETNPLLSRRDDVLVFRNIITQSNATHKSVPMMLSSVPASQHRELYRRSGILALFNEAGFTTYFLSNQSPQGAMIDELAHDATCVMYMDLPRFDEQLVDAMRDVLVKDDSQKIFFVLHTYGSHFSYRQRYPREFARFLPDDNVTISRNNVAVIRNAYDNSICYTDYVINKVITMLETLDGVSSAMLYCSDHGEDLFDGGESRFLHASPMVTYYQLHIPSLMWFSSKYKELYPHKVEAAKANEMAPATTYSVFHTMADLANITSPYVVGEVSLLNRCFDYAAMRYYLNDHNQAVRFDREIGVSDEEFILFSRQGIEL